MVSNAANGEPVVDTSVKDSLEMSFPANDPSYCLEKVSTQLEGGHGFVSRRLPLCRGVRCVLHHGPDQCAIVPAFGGYKTFHTERTGRGEPEGSRHLVFMTYLNDVTDAGGTEFCHQNLIVWTEEAIDARRYFNLAGRLESVRTVGACRRPRQEKIITTGWSRAVCSPPEINRNRRA